MNAPTATKIDLLTLRTEIARAKADVMKWVLLIAMSVQTVVIVGAIVALSRVAR